MTDPSGVSQTEQLAQLHAQRVRHGMRQMELVKAMLEHRTEAAGIGLEGAIDAGFRTAAFAWREGWVRGPAWSAYGGRWLVALWALSNGHTDAEVGSAFEAAAAQRAARRQEASSRSEDSPATPDALRATLARTRYARHQERRRGQEQVEALQVLIGHLSRGSDELSAAVPAARHAADFATAEGWAEGHLWSAYGAQMLLGRWALEQGITGDQLGQHLVDAAQPADQ